MSRSTRKVDIGRLVDDAWKKHGNDFPRGTHANLPWEIRGTAGKGREGEVCGVQVEKPEFGVTRIDGRKVKILWQCERREKGSRTVRGCPAWVDKGRSNAGNATEKKLGVHTKSGQGKGRQ